MASSRSYAERAPPPLPLTLALVLAESPLPPCRTFPTPCSINIQALIGIRSTHGNPHAGFLRDSRLQPHQSFQELYRRRVGRLLHRRNLRKSQSRRHPRRSRYLPEIRQG